MTVSNVVQLPDLSAQRREQRENATIRRALNILSRRMGQPGQLLTSPKIVKDYLRLRIGGREHEVFVVLFVDVKHRLIGCEEMFRGTLTSSSVYPREVLKTAMAYNASGIILAHNHPSGVPEPSGADLTLTSRIKDVVELVDVRVLDHVIVTPCETYSFAEHGTL